MRTGGPKVSGQQHSCIRSRGVCRHEAERRLWLYVSPLRRCCPLGIQQTRPQLVDEGSVPGNSRLGRILIRTIPRDTRRNNVPVNVDGVTALKLYRSKAIRIVLLNFPRRVFDARVTLLTRVRRMNQAPGRTRTSVDRRKVLNVRTFLDDLSVGQQSGNQTRRNVLEMPRDYIANGRCPSDQGHVVRRVCERQVPTGNRRDPGARLS